MKKYFLKYGFEFVVIFFGILISLYFEQSRQNRIENERKNNSIEQLIKVIDQDLLQIDNFILLQQMSLESSDKLYDNLRYDEKLSEDKIIYHISSVGRALKSFFPQEGIFNQLISSDLIKRINSETLKSRLFKLFNEDLKRHDVHTKEYDEFFLSFNYKLSVNFFLEHNWKTDASEVNQIEIKKYRFNNSFYTSDEFFGNLIEARKNISAYLTELQDLKTKYSDLKSLCIDEIS
ncbi:MAG: hypothetical protein VXX71_01250 [Bacteroidota bacterium]|jgi:hypothetical protein|nr:hypothetical protein [Bacteroidota bacterium]MEC8702700.1 hypothetical protein [Bacteroidota bacterium]|tara:strand:- start:884 stop:1585 length:702 start_codon:yes stop_codon:yes gene_type:complete